MYVYIYIYIYIYIDIWSQVDEWVKSWQRHNPTFEYWFWTDSGARETLRRRYPPWMGALYDAYPHAINRADVRKYLILYLHGGIVADLDTECLRPLDALVGGGVSAVENGPRYSCIVGEEPELHRVFLYGRPMTLSKGAASSTSAAAAATAAADADSPPSTFYVTSSFIACRRRHPFLEFVLRRLPTYAGNAKRLGWNENVLNSTGPTFLTESVDAYRRLRLDRVEDGSVDADVFVAPADWFVPTFDPINVNAFRLGCKVMAAAAGGGRKSSVSAPAAVSGFPGTEEVRPSVCDRLLSPTRGSGGGAVDHGGGDEATPDAFTTHHWLHSWAVDFIPRGWTRVEDLVNVTRLVL